MTDLAAQIIAALDRAEETAQAATPGPWVARTTGVRGGDHWYICDSGQSIAHISANDGVDEEQRPLDAAHVAANDPAHVLRLTTALREVATMCADQLAMNTPPSAVNSEVVWLAEDTLRALASVWDVPGDNT